MDFFNCTISREDRFQLRDWMDASETFSSIIRESIVRIDAKISQEYSPRVTLKRKKTISNSSYLKAYENRVSFFRNGCEILRDEESRKRRLIDNRRNTDKVKSKLNRGVDRRFVRHFSRRKICLESWTPGIRMKRGQ